MTTSYNIELTVRENVEKNLPRENMKEVFSSLKKPD